MSLIRSLQATKAVYENPVTVDVIQPERWRRDADWSPEWFFGNAGVDYHFSHKGHISSLNAYQICSPLAAIINKQAQSHINGKTWITDTKGKRKGKESESVFAGKVKRLLFNPNPLQTWKEFEAQQKIYMKVFGWCFVLPIIPVGFERFGLSEASSMWNIPPYMVDIDETNKLFYQTDLKGIISTVKLKYKQTTSELDVNSLLLFKDFIPSMGDTLIFPTTRIQSCRMPINNIIGAYESRNSLINHAGAQGLFSPDSDANGPVPLKQLEKEQLQRDFHRYGVKKDQWKYIFSPTKITWQQVGRPTRDLMLFEEIEDDIRRIADEFNHPYRLLSQETNSLGGADLKVHTRNLYQDAIEPDAEMIYEVWNRAFKTEENNCLLEKSFRHIDALQEDKLNNAKARREINEACKVEFYNNVIKLNRWRELNDEDALETVMLDNQVVDIGNMYFFELKKLGIEFGGVSGSTPQNIDNGTGTEAEGNGDEEKRKN